MELVRSLKCFPLGEIGSLEWFANKQAITTLHQNIVSEMQHVEVSPTARMIQEEDKTVVLLQELIAVDEWKRTVLQEIKKKDNALYQVFPIYSILFIESVQVSVLLCVLYSHENDLVNMLDEDILAELIDHCVQHLITLIGITNNKIPIDEQSDKLQENISNTERINQFELDLQYQVCNLFLSVLRLVLDHTEELSLSLLTRVVQHHDVAILLVHLIEHEAWSNSNTAGVPVKYNDSWTVVPANERFLLGKYEAQTWSMLLNLLIQPRCAELYEISIFRKNELLKLEKHLTDILMDQFPSLGRLRQWFAQVKMTSGRSVAAKPLILELEANSMRQGLVRDLNIAQIVDDFARMLNNVEYLRVVAAKHSEVYVNFEKLCVARSGATQAAERQCGACEGRAKFKCSRCKSVWYCDKACQMKHWAVHKKLCSV